MSIGPMSIAGRWHCAFAVFALSLAWLRPAGAVVDEASLLPVDQAFALTATDTGDAVELHWKIADGYYLYRHRIKISAIGDARLGALALPKGAPHDDEFFGKVETYRKQLAARVPVTTTADSVELKVGYQGCADAGVCYPPQTRRLRVPLSHPAAPINRSDDPGFASLGRSLGASRTAPLGDAVGNAGTTLANGKAAPLPEDQAFGFEAIAADGNTILLRFTPARGYYLYRDKTTLAPDTGDMRLGAPRWPAGTQHRDEHFGNVVVFFDQIDVPLPLIRKQGDAARKITLTASFQGCQDEGICYPVMTRKAVVSLPAARAIAMPAPAASPSTMSSVAPPRSNATPAIGAEPSTADGSAAADASTRDSLPTATDTTRARDSATVATTAGEGRELAEDSRLAASLAGPGRWLALFGFFGTGLLLAFTPCVYPMIPILIGLITGSGARLGTRRALWLSFVYVLANALVFTAAGVIAALLGANLQAAFQTPWVLVLFALLFVALALSSFGLYEIQLPAALRSTLSSASDRQRGGSLAGVAAMGALSALIVGPCVAPPLAAAVLYIGQSHDPVFGGLALFVLAMGMGVPLLIFGAAAGRGMPTSGPWMIAVQRVFGFVFLGLAVWMLSRIVPGPVTLALFGLLAMAAAAWAFNGTRSGDGRLQWLARFAGLVLAVVGAAQLLGALGGGRDPLQPLSGLFNGNDNARTRELAFRPIKSTQDLDREIAAARSAGKPLLFDFYADWCVSCKEMERDTFSDPAVHAALADVVLLKADVTANDAIDQALMRRFGIIGPPATLFFVDGAERRALRLVGFEAVEPFVARVQRASANN